MPPDTIGQPGTLYLYRNHVEIVTKAGPRVRHPRCARGVLSLLPEHRAAMLGAVRGARARLYYQRQSLWELGPVARPGSRSSCIGGPRSGGWMSNSASRCCRRRAPSRSGPRSRAACASTRSAPST